MTTIRLVVQGGKLYFPSADPALLYRTYPAGDIDTCPWPFDPGNTELAYRLAIALYDERESNDEFPTSAVIELPDGTVFDFDTVLADIEAAGANRQCVACDWHGLTMRYHGTTGPMCPQCDAPTERRTPHGT